MTYQNTEYNTGNTSQYQELRVPYGDNKPLYGDNRQPYGDNKPLYGDNRQPYGDNKLLYGDNRQQYGDNKPLYCDNKPLHGGIRQLHGDKKLLYGENKPLHGENKPLYDDNRQQFVVNRIPYAEHRTPNIDNRIPHGDNRMPYGDNRIPHGDNRAPNVDSRMPFGDNQPPYNDNKPQFGDNQPPYNDGKPLYGDNPPPYNEGKPPYGDNQPPYNDSKPTYGDKIPLYGDNKVQYNGSQPMYGDNRPPYDDNRPLYGDNRQLYGDNRPPYDSKPGDSKVPYSDGKPLYGDNRGSFGDNSQHTWKKEKNNSIQQTSSYNRQEGIPPSDNYNTPNRYFSPQKPPQNYGGDGCNSGGNRYDNYNNKPYPTDSQPPQREPFSPTMPPNKLHHGFDHGRGYPQSFNEPSFASPPQERLDQYGANQGYQGRGRGCNAGKTWQSPNRGRGNRGRGLNMASGRGTQQEGNNSTSVQSSIGGRTQRDRGRRRRGRDGNQFQTKTNENNSFMQPTKVAVEGEPTFISYKNSLQEYTQKVFKHVPRYTIVKADAGYSANVEVNDTVYSCQMPQRDKRYAEQGAAFEALKGYGVVNASAVYTAKGTKRPIRELRAETEMAKPTKTQKTQLNAAIPCMAVMTHKCKLNEMCQKLKSSPTYMCEKVDGGFICTVVLDGQVYQSSQVCSSKKLAEQNAAQVVLSQLNVDTVSSSVNDAATATNVTNATFITPITTISGPIPAPIGSTPTPITSKPGLPSRKSMKNLIQEYCQKNGMSVPKYSTIKEAGVCISTVNINGREFVGTPHILKKTAQQNAARKAFEGLGLH